MITPPFLEMGQKKGLFKLQVKSQKSSQTNQSNAYTLYNHTYHLNPIQCYSFMLCIIIATHQITYLQEIIASHKPVM